MRRRGTGLATTVLVALVMVAVIAPSAIAQPLQNSIELLVSRAGLGDGAVVGVSVIDTKTGQVLAGLNASTPLIPASNLKLLSSGAALRTLGADFAFRTRVSLLEDGTLLIVGDGDPAFGDDEVLGSFDPPLGVENVLASIADGVAATGTVKLEQIIVDDRVFDHELIHPDWPTDQLHRAYCAPVSGLSFHTNTISFFPIRPRGGGTTPDIEYEPRSSSLDVRVRAALKDAGRNTVWVRRDGPRTFTLLGNLRHSLQSPIQVPVEEPALMFGEFLAERLNERGVSIHRDSVLRTNADAIYGEGRPIAEVVTPIAEVLRRCNQDSQNMYAESLLKRSAYEVTGEPGSWESGSAVLRMLVGDTIGSDDAASMIIRDGSGLSKENRVRASTLSKWLVALSNNASVSDAFIDSLPEPGEGTLRRRFKDSKLENTVHAKSGTVSGVRCLSGYVTDEETGRTIAFSVLVNGLRTGPSAVRAKTLHEDIVEKVDDYLVRLSELEIKQGG